MVRTTGSARPHVSLPVEDGGENGGTGLKCVFVEQDGKVVTVGVGVELDRDTWCVIAGFLKERICVGFLRAGLGFRGGTCCACGH